MYNNLNFVIISLVIISVIVRVALAQIEFTEHVIANDFGGATSVFPIDLDGDGDIDILGAAFNDHDITWWENNGNQEFTEHTIEGRFRGAKQVFAADIDSDGDLDVLGAAESDDDILWWENDGEQNFSRRVVTEDFDGAASVYAADLDGDGDMDVLGTASNVRDLIWWENDGEQDFRERVIVENANNPYNTVHAVDIDDDDDIDVLSGNRETLGLKRNDGDGNFRGANGVWGQWINIVSIYATDLDGDGDMDVLGASNRGWGDNSGDIIWSENDGEGAIGGENGRDYHSIAGDRYHGAMSVYAADMDDDGDIDVLGVAYEADDITWFENGDDQNFIEHTIDGDFDGARSVYAADMDGDGDMDVVGAAMAADEIIWWEAEIIQLGWRELPEIRFNEDNSAQRSLEYFFGQHLSPNIPDSLITISITGGEFVHVEIEDELVNIVPVPNFNGIDSLMLIVSDADENTDTTYQHITVRSLGDLPAEFSLLGPPDESALDSLIVHFSWETAVQNEWEHDPVRYYLDFYCQTEGFEIGHTYQNTLDTNYAYVAIDSIAEIMMLEYGGSDYQFEWWVTAADYGGMVECTERFSFSIPYLEVDSDSQGTIPRDYSVLPAFPNPFNSSTTITYGLPVASKISIAIYDISGDLVTTLNNGIIPAGVHNTVWNADKLATGMYFIHAEAANWRQTRKVMLVR